LNSPYDVADAGRAAALLDPTGAMFWVWQPRQHIGAGHVNDIGCLMRWGPTRVGAGTIALVGDPTGAVFGLFEGPIDD